jgi:hypothetical protein
MRIVIEIDGVEGTAHATRSSDRHANASDEALGDGGAGPDLRGSGAPDADTADADSGPPPDWLLEAVAAAEAEGRDAATEGADTDGQPGDAGPGPSD